MVRVAVVVGKFNSGGKKSLVMEYFDAATDALKAGAEVEKLIALPSREKIGRFKYVENDKINAEYEEILKQMNREIAESMPKEEF